MELIDRDALKSEYLSHHQGAPGGAFKLICEAPTVNQWISVKDKLPENDQAVLCWYEYYRYGEYNCMYQTYGIGYCIDGYWGGEVSNGSQAKVLYWMPLPTTPKSKSKQTYLEKYKEKFPMTFEKIGADIIMEAKCPKDVFPEFVIPSECGKKCKNRIECWNLKEN